MIFNNSKYAIVMLMTLTLCMSCRQTNEAAKERVMTLQKEGFEEINKGNYDIAEKKFMSAIELEPENQAIQNNLAVLYIQYMKQPEKAIKVLEELLKKGPKNSVYWNNIAGVYKGKGDLEKAISSYQEAKKYSQNSYQMPYFNIGLIYIEQKKFPEAIAEFREGLRISPKDSMLLFGLAQAMLLNNQAKETQVMLMQRYRENKFAPQESLFLVHLNYRLNEHSENKRIISDNILNPQAVDYFKIEEMLNEINTGIDEKTLLDLFEKSGLESNSKLKSWIKEFFIGMALSQREKHSESINKLSEIEGQIGPEWTYYEALRQWTIACSYMSQNDPEKANKYFSLAEKLLPEYFSHYYIDLMRSN